MSTAALVLARAGLHYFCRLCRHHIRPCTTEQRKRGVFGEEHYVVTLGHNNRIRFCLKHTEEAIRGKLRLLEAKKPNIDAYLQQLAAQGVAPIDPQPVARRFQVKRRTVIKHLVKLNLLPKRPRGRPSRQVA